MITKDYSKYLPGQVWYVEGENDPSKWKHGVLEKTRPWLIVNITTKGSAICIPITSSDHDMRNNPTAVVPIHFRDETNWFVLNQSKTIPFELFSKYMYTIDAELFKTVVTSYSNMLMGGIPTYAEPVAIPSKPIVEKKVNTITVVERPSTDPQGHPMVAASIKKDFNNMPMHQLIKKYGLPKYKICQIANG